MIRGPRISALVAFAALALSEGCAGAPARPASALGPDVSGVSTPALPPAALASEDSGVFAPARSADEGSVSSSPPAVSGGRGRERRAIAPPVEPPAGEPVTGARAQVIEAARGMLGTRPRLDCSGFVLAALAEAGVSPDLPPARSRSESLFLARRLVTRPSPGDLVFFHRTHDRDRKGSRAQRNRFTHVALVETVDGTQLTLLHRGGRRVERIRMDLSRPSDPAANDPVRFRRKRDRPGTRYLSGELFAAFGGLLPDDVTRKLQARRGRDTPARHPASR